MEARKKKILVVGGASAVAAVALSYALTKPRRRPPPPAARAAPKVDLTMTIVGLPEIKAAYERNGGAAVLGTPLSPAVAVKGGKGFVQPLTGTPGYPAAIFARDGQAFVVQGGFYQLHTHFGGLKIGWPIEDEYTVVKKGIGLSQGREERYQVQHFSSRIKFQWSHTTKRLTANRDMVRLYDSNPPPKKEAWYEASWAAAALYLAYPPAGVAAIIAQNPEESKAIALAVATDPKVIGAVGVGVILAVPTGGASLAAAAPVVGNAVVGAMSEAAVTKIKSKASAALSEGKKT